MIDIYGYLVYTINLISNSVYGKYFILKGGSALVSKMIENNRKDLYRLTSDIDIHCNSWDIWTNFCRDIIPILNSNDRGYHYTLVKRRVDTKPSTTTDSLKFNLITPQEQSIDFKMDMNVKSNSIITVDYSPILKMNIYSKYTMLVDKISVVSSRSIFRRIKDFYDLGVLISLYDFDLNTIRKHFSIKNPNAKLVNMLVKNNFDNINHAYSKYQGILNKPNILVLWSYCETFLRPIYEGKENLIWNHITGTWTSI